MQPTGWELELFNGRLTTIKNGYAEPPTEPGLGLALNWDVAKKHPHKPANPEMYFEDGSITDH